jgi:hypothetical protein
MVKYHMGEEGRGGRLSMKRLFHKNRLRVNKYCCILKDLPTGSGA